MPEFRLPDLGEGLASAEIVGWRVAVGDRVEVDQVVVEVETAKAAVEVPIPYAGVVAACFGATGETVAVGTPLLSIRADAEDAGGGDSVGDASGNVLIGFGPRPEPAHRGSARRRAARRVPSVPSPDPVDGPDEARGPIAVISPLVRKLARDRGLDLRRITGTGPSGLIRRSDVDAAVPTDRRAGDDGELRIPLTGVRRVAAERLGRSRREIPEATVWVDVDATGLLAARATLNQRDPARPVSLLALLGRFTVLGLRRYPELNAHLDGDEIVVPARVNLGFAAQTDRGLVVPVVAGADRLGTRDLSAALADRTAAARAGRLTPADLRGGTITINNYGVFGVDGSAAIINWPEVAIVGLGRVIERPWVVDGQLAVRQVSQLTLTFDHRVCDGATAGGFLRFVADCVETPLLALE